MRIITHGLEKEVVNQKAYFTSMKTDPKFRSPVWVWQSSCPQMRRQVDHICVCGYQVHDLSLGTGGICHEHFHLLQPLKVMQHFLNSIFIIYENSLYFYILFLLFSFIFSLCLCISSRVIHVLHFADKRTQTLSIGELSRPQLVRVSNGAF